MEINFAVGNIPVKLVRGWFLGGMKLVTPSGDVWIQHPLRLGTHFSFRLKQCWQQDISGRQVRIEKTRPLLVGGVRPQSYKVFVDGELVASDQGF